MAPNNPGPPQQWTGIKPSAPGTFLMAPASARQFPVVVYVREVGDTLWIHGEGLTDRPVDDLPPAHVYMGTIPRESKPVQAGEATGRATQARGAWSALADETVAVLTVGPDLKGGDA